MIKEAICTGDSIEEAKEKALLELNAGIEEDVQIEVLATPKAKTLGLFGGSKAKVRVFVELPDPAPKKEKKAECEKPAKNAPAKEAKPEAVADKTPAEELPEAIPASEIAADTNAGRAVAYLSKILGGLGCEDFSITVQLLENSVILNLEGEGLGVVIGRRGETLDALQYLTSLSCNNGGGYYRVNINIGNYRERREATLRSLAKRMSAQAIRTGRSRSLEPMNPYERRIIHTTVQGIEGVTSSSSGEGNNRYVVIRPEGGAHGRDDYRRGGRGDRRSRPRNSAPAPAVDPNREVKKDNESFALYSKIN